MSKKGRGRRRGLRLYFDTSAYDFINSTGETGVVKRWLMDNGHSLRASDEANIGELLRIPDQNERAAQIRLITALAELCERPTDLIMSEEMLREIRRCRPGWITTEPSLDYTASFLAWRRREAWDALRKDPSALPPEAQAALAEIGKVIGANKVAQAMRRSSHLQQARLLVRTSLQDLQPIIDGYAEVERYVRAQLFHDWSLLLTEPVTVSAETTWLAPLLDLVAMFRVPREDWQRFCIVEVDLAQIPMNRISVLTEYCQHGKQVTFGNTVDRIHACHLVDFDRVVTADKDFYEVMKEVLSLMTVPGIPIYIDQATGSAVAELSQKIR
jgi:hypothetical protein